LIGKDFLLEQNEARKWKYALLHRADKWASVQFSSPMAEKERQG
jgi:hypothetical protein